MHRRERDLRFYARLSVWATLLFWVILLATGIALTTYHETPRGSGSELRHITFDVPFGMVMRNLHNIAAHLLVAGAIVAGLLIVLAWIGKRGLLWRAVGSSVGLALLLALGLSFDWFPPGLLAARASPLLGREGPFSELVGTHPKFDARTLLAGGALMDGALRRSLVYHSVGVPLAGAAFIGFAFAATRRRRLE
jgi:quinol-cytochrome oxidoreductase complex cytochrome b subunit